MKKFLLSVVVALMSAVMWNGVNARLVQGKRIPASLIKAGDTIALEGRFKGWFLGVGTRGTSLEFCSEEYNETSWQARSSWVVSEGPLNAWGKTYYLKNVYSHRYLGGDKKPMVYGPASLYPTSSINYALPLSIRSAEDYRDVANPTGEENEFVWDNNSAVFYSYDDSKYVSWRECLDPLKDLLFTENHDTNAWNVYRMTSEHDLSDELQALIDEYTSEGLEHAVGGTNPGYYQEDVAKEYNDIFEKSKIFVGGQHSEEEFKAQSDKLKAIHDKLLSAFIPITEGYYTIVNSVVLSSSPTVAAYANSSAMQLYFAPYDSNDPKFVFYVTKAEEDNEYYIEHFLSGTYVGDMDAWYNSYTEMTQSKAVPQHITLGREGWFWGSHQFHTTSKNPFAPSTPLDLNNHDGPLITWGNKDEGYGRGSNRWWLHMITDQTLIDKFKAEKEHAALNATLSDLVKTGDDLYKSLFSYKPDYGNPLITRANGGYGEESTDDAQIMFDEVSYLGGENNDKYEGLFYDDNTYIRGAGGITLRFDEPKQDLKLFYFAKDGEGLGMVTIEGMNTVVGDTNYDYMLARFNMDMNRTSDWTSIHLDRPCDRVHFRVSCNSTGGRFFTLNYIVVYEAVVDEGASLYHKTTGLKEPADKLSALIAAKKAIVEAGTATNEDIKELEDAILAVKALLSPASVELQQLIDAYGSEGDYVGGTDPGYYQEDVVQEYNNVLRESKKFVMNQHSEDELQAQIDKLKAAHAKLASALIPITEGYYYLVNGFDDFFNKFGVEKAAYATTETLRYDTFDSENSKFVFHITETDNDNGFSLEHVLTGAYVGQDWGATYNSTCMDTKGTGIVQEFSLKSPGKWSWADVRNNASKTPYATDNPVADNSEGPLATWAGSDSHSNLWYLRKITDQDFIDKVINEKAEKQPLWDELDNIIAKAQSYPLGNDYGQFSYDKSFYDVIPLAIQVSQRRTATAEEIQYWVDAVSDCISKLALNMPADGALIRIKDSNGNYMTCNNNSSNSNRIEFSATKDEASIFCYTGDALVSYKTGLYASNTTGVRPFPTNATSVITEGEATLYHILQSGLTLGKYLVSFGSDTRFMYTNADAGTFSSASNISNTGYEFTIEAVESIPVTIGRARVATLYSPQALIIPEGITAYTGTYTGNSIQLTPLTGDIIPANTGVIVEGEANTTYNLYITNGGEDATSCLGGTVPAISTTSGAYTLQIVDGQLGFYRYTGENLAGFKAFFTNSTGAKGFSLVKDDFTGINGVFDNQIEGVYYDLMGNMVKHPLKNHIYIFNGAKVLK